MGDTNRNLKGEDCIRTYIFYEVDEELMYDYLFYCVWATIVGGHRRFTISCPVHYYFVYDTQVITVKRIENGFRSPHLKNKIE